MEGEILETTSRHSDDEDYIKSKKTIKKYSKILSSDEEGNQFDTGNGENEKKNIEESTSEDSGVDENTPSERVSKRSRISNRFKSYDSSESDYDATNVKSDVEMKNQYDSSRGTSPSRNVCNEMFSINRSNDFIVSPKIYYYM